MSSDSYKILLIEDNPGDARLMGEYLADCNFQSYQLIIKNDLASGIKTLKRDKYSLVLLDLSLPDSSGIQTFKDVKKVSDSLPIVILSGLHDEALSQEIVNMGAQDYLVKGSFDTTLLEKTIRYSIERGNFSSKIVSSEKRLNKIFDHTADGIIVFDKKKVIMYANRAVLKLLGKQKNELTHQEFKYRFDLKSTVVEEIITPKENIYVEIRTVISEWDDKEVYIASMRDITRRFKDRKQIAHLNNVLKSIRKINHLIVSEENPQNLIKSACDILVDNESYSSAWIILINQDFKIEYSASGNIDHNFETLIKPGTASGINCINKMLAIDDSLLNIERKEVCVDCPIADQYISDLPVLIKIKYQNQLFGFINVTTQPESAFDPEEHSLLKEVAGDIGFALHSISIQKEQRDAQSLLNLQASTLQAAANAIVITDIEGNISWVNDAFIKLTGYSEEEILSNKPSKLKSGLHQQSFYKDLWDTIKAGEVWHGEMCNRKKSGELYFENMTITPVKNDENEITHFIAIKEDITEIKKHREEIEKSKIRFESLYNLRQILSKNEKDLIQFALEETVKMTESTVGYFHLLNEDEQSLQLYIWSDIVKEMCSTDIPSHYPIQEAGIWADCVRDRKPVIHNNYKQLEEKKGLPEGHFPISSHMSVPIFEKDRIVAIIGVGNKSSDYDSDDARQVELYMSELWKMVTQQRTESKLKQSESKFEAIYNAANTGIVLTDQHGNIINCNKAFAKIIDKPLGKILNTNYATLLGEQSKKIKELVGDRDDPNEKPSINVDVEYIRPNGEKVWGEVIVSLIRNENGNILNFVAIITDITARKLADEALKDSEEKFRSLYQNATIGIYQSTPEGDLIMANPAMLSMLGYETLEEIKNIKLEDPNGINPEKREEFKNIISEEGIVYGFIDKWQRKDGTLITIQESARVVVSKDGNLSYYEGVVEDISERVKLEADLIQAKEKAEVGERIKSEFLAQMSHEIRTPINSIMSFTQFLKDEFENQLDDESKSTFEIMEIAGKRITRTVDLVLNMAEIESGAYEHKPVKLNIKRLAELIVNEFRPMADNKNLELYLECDVKSPFIYAEEYCVTQILTNLVDNAIKYTNDGGVLLMISLNSENQIELHVKDSGIGISDDYLPHLFESFSQEMHGYSRDYDGNGLGLALVKKYCGFNEAKIDVITEKGRGSQFTVTFTAELPED
ncbi:MAG: PAS domain S-box protein [Melioribacteraceae bacterium]|nr:PAS domain S-box protein [Melioribacteraceae bacterium]MCF8265903.1 PAS domain S-box protein [Melioribacteraceae bacterium]